MKYLNIDDILNANDLPTGDVDVPEWGGVVKVQGLSKKRQIQARNESRNDDGELDSEKLELLMFITCVIEPKFEVSHIERLRDKSASAFDRVNLAIMNLNGDTKEAADQSADDFPDGDKTRQGK